MRAFLSFFKAFQMLMIFQSSLNYLSTLSEFSVMLPCSNLTSGIAKFSLGLLIMKGRGKLLPGTPLRFTLRKECSHRGMNSSIDYSPHSQGSVLISAFKI